MKKQPILKEFLTFKHNGRPLVMGWKKDNMGENILFMIGPPVSNDQFDAQVTRNFQFSDDMTPRELMEQEAVVGLMTDALHENFGLPEGDGDDSFIARLNRFLDENLEYHNGYFRLKS